MSKSRGKNETIAGRLYKKGKKKRKGEKRRNETKGGKKGRK